MRPATEFFPKQGHTVTITILGATKEERNKLVLMKNFVDQDDSDNVCGASRVTIPFDLSSHGSLNVVIGGINDTTNGSLLRASSFNSDCLVFCYDDFNAHELEKQFKALSSLINDKVTICLVGLKNKTSLKGVEEAKKFAERNGWAHHGLELNSLRDTNDFFLAQIQTILRKRGIDEHIIEEDVPDAISAFASSPKASHAH